MGLVSCQHNIFTQIHHLFLPEKSFVETFIFFVMFDPSIKHGSTGITDKHSD